MYQAEWIHFNALLIGALAGLYSCFIEYGHLKEIASGVWVIVLCLFIILISSGIVMLMYNYIFTYILYWFGKLLGSNGVVADTRTVITYSLTPGIINLFILWTISYISKQTGLDTELQLWTQRIISIVFFTWTMTIIVIGFKTLNKYGIVKAILNLFPLIAIGLFYLWIKHSLIHN